MASMTLSATAATRGAAPRGSTLRSKAKTTTRKAVTTTTRAMGGSESSEARVRDSRGDGARRVVVRTRASSAETASGAELVARSKEYCADLKEMGMPMSLIRRAVAGDKNDLKKLKVFQEALDGGAVAPEDEDEAARLDRVLGELNELRQDKAEEELFWAEREGKIVSGLTDGTGLSEQDKSEVGNMVANITMYGVQGAVWNAMILLVGGMVMISVLR